MTSRRRLDLELVRRGLVASREEARHAIEDGRVIVGGAPALKVSRLVDPAEALIVAGEGPRFVSRGGEKLDAALTTFGVEVEGRDALDAGASTGGFTDCLLQRGVRRVLAIDVGRGQLHPRIADDPRVEVRDRTNVRHLSGAEVGAFDLVVADLAFISLATVAPVLAGELAEPDGDLVWLVKPQFEAGRQEAARGRGVIRDQSVWLAALERVASALEAAGAAIMGAMVSPLKGADGNVEFFLYARAHRAAPGVRADPPVRPDLAAVTRRAAQP